MSQNISSGELADLIVKKTGISKKMAVQILHAIPEVVEEGLKRDSEVRVKGMGTFRMTWIRDRSGRNPKTGVKVLIPAHYKLVFLPEQSFKDYINRDFRLLSYKLIPEAGANPFEEDITYAPIADRRPLSYPHPDSQHEMPKEPEPASTPDRQPGSLPPGEKRRIHWIVPAAIVVIVILSVVFYFRNFNPVDSRKSLVVSQQHVLNPPLADEGSAAEQSDVLSEAKDLNQQHVLSPPEADEGSAVSSPEPADSIKNSKFKIQNSKLITSVDGKHLFQLAREVYGNPYLWVLIYQANTEKIADPDMLISGRELFIPALEGKPDHLSRNDSLSVAEGYRLVFDLYRSKNDPRADEFQRAYLRYRP